MVYLAFAYERNGWGVVKDREQAFYLFKKASELGNPKAMCFYSSFLRFGILNCVEKNPDLSLIWARKAMNSTDEFAIGKTMSFLKKDFLHNLKEALKHLELAANEGDEFMLHFLDFHREGYGFSLDLEMAFIWSKKAAEIGSGSAQLKLARMLRNGNGCNKDIGSSLIWFKKALNQGFDEAENEMQCF